jgi:hypothetical protein
MNRKGILWVLRIVQAIDPTLQPVIPTELDWFSSPLLQTDRCHSLDDRRNEASVALLTSVPDQHHRETYSEQTGA